jgi:hypothetical protein
MAAMHHVNAVIDWKACRDKRCTSDEGLLWSDDLEICLRLSSSGASMNNYDRADLLLLAVMKIAKLVL